MAVRSSLPLALGHRSGQVSAYCMGSDISGTPSCAMTVPSRSSTAECTTLSGCIRISISSGDTPKRCIASMNSRPLFIMVAESTLILAPIDQFGCLTACAGVTDAVCSRVQPRKGPPEPVSSILRSSPSLPQRHWKMALCSLSTGTISAPVSAARAMTMLPAQTRVSLLARAMRRFRPMASSVGRRPTAPDTAVTTQSVSCQDAAMRSPSSPGGPTVILLPESS